MFGRSGLERPSSPNIHPQSVTPHALMQNMMTAPAVITLIAFLLNIGFNALLIKLLGFKGAPLATSLSRFIQFLLLALVVYRHECKRSAEAAAEARRLTAGKEQGDINGDSSLTPPAGSEARDAESALQLEMEPLRGGQDGSGPSSLLSSSEPFPAPLNTLAGNKRLLRQPSWFRVPSFRDMQGHMATASSQLGLADLLGGPSGGGAQAHSLGDTARYLLAQSRAAMRPAMVLRFLKLALPGGFMMAFEAGSFDFTTAMAGHLGSPVVTAAHSAMFAIIYLTYTTFPFAIATAATIRQADATTQQGPPHSSAPSHQYNGP